MPHRDNRFSRILSNLVTASIFCCALLTVRQFWRYFTPNEIEVCFGGSTHASIVKLAMFTVPTIVTVFLRLIPDFYDDHEIEFHEMRFSHSPIKLGMTVVTINTVFTFLFMKDVEGLIDIIMLITASMTSVANFLFTDAPVLNLSKMSQVVALETVLFLATTSCVLLNVHGSFLLYFVLFTQCLQFVIVATDFYLKAIHAEVVHAE